MSKLIYAYIQEIEQSHTIKIWPTTIKPTTRDDFFQSYFRDGVLHIIYVLTLSQNNSEQSTILDLR